MTEKTIDDKKIIKDEDVEAVTKKIEKKIEKKEKELEKKQKELEQKEECLIQVKKMEELLRHLKNVHNACEILGKKLMESGETDFGRILIANSFLHDNSKFYGVEWEHLHYDTAKEKPDIFGIALNQHQQVNSHHPEYWGGIEEMPRIYVAEMVCDWYSRSVEMGTDLRDYFMNVALDRFAIKKNSKKYKEIKFFIDMILNKPFTKPKK